MPPIPAAALLVVPASNPNPNPNTASRNAHNVPPTGPGTTGASGAPAAALPPPPYNQDLPSGNRPQLPARARNRFLGQAPTASDPDALVVKFQTIVREEREIVVGRLKIATSASNEHAFILRRYDTGAISVTTMFKAAFPTANAEEEEREMRWIKSTFDLTGMNGGRANHSVKLAGNWIPPSLATHLAPAYKLVSWIHAMVEASPEAGVAYRKSQRSQAAAQEAATRTNGNLVAAPHVNAPGAPGPGPLQAPNTGVHTSRGPVAPPRTVRNPTSPTDTARPAPASPSTGAAAPKRARTEASSNGTVVPPRAGSVSALSSSRTAAQFSPAQAGQPQSNIEEPTVAVTIQTVTEIIGPADIEIDAEEEIAENRAMVARMTAEYQARSAAGESAEEMGLIQTDDAGPSGSVRGIKRTVDETQTADVTQSGSGAGSSVTVSTDGFETEGRLIAGNRRIKVVAPEVANRGNAMWGPAVLAVGGAVGWLAANYWL